MNLPQQFNFPRYLTTGLAMPREGITAEKISEFLSAPKYRDEPATFRARVIRASRRYSQATGGQFSLGDEEKLVA